jgi:beta-ribofuranosylaminobenzene 5'-phosphate synthase
VTRVSVGGRLHVGFQNLSLAHERLYGGVGVALAEPRVTVEAEPADAVDSADGLDSPDSVDSAGGIDHATVVDRTDEIDNAAGVDRADDLAREYAARACELLDVPGARVAVREPLPRHVGLGSGTQLALAVLSAVALAHDRAPRVRERAPALGRGGRSGVGIATFECGGFVVDAGHPTEQFTTHRPADGEWTVPPVVARHALPDDWRFVVALPDAPGGRSGDGEDATIRSVVERADPGVADDLAAVLTRRLLPASAAGRLGAFGRAVTEFGRLNGAWYAEEQGGVYRPPVGRIVERLREESSVVGVGQSSWGPAVYAVTDVDRADEAGRAAERTLEAANAAGDVLVTRPDNEGARVE